MKLTVQQIIEFAKWFESCGFEYDPGMKCWLEYGQDSEYPDTYVCDTDEELIELWLHIQPQSDGHRTGNKPK